MVQPIAELLVAMEQAAAELEAAATEQPAVEQLEVEQTVAEQPVPRVRLVMKPRDEARGPVTRPGSGDGCCSSFTLVCRADVRYSILASVYYMRAIEKTSLHVLCQCARDSHTSGPALSIVPAGHLALLRRLHLLALLLDAP